MKLCRSRPGLADLGVVVGLGFWMVEWVTGVVDFGFDFDFDFDFG